MFQCKSFLWLLYNTCKEANICHVSMSLEDDLLKKQEKLDFPVMLHSWWMRAAYIVGPQDSCFTLSASSPSSPPLHFTSHKKKKERRKEIFKSSSFRFCLPFCSSMFLSYVPYTLSPFPSSLYIHDGGYIMMKFSHQLPDSLPYGRILPWLMTNMTAGFPNVILSDLTDCLLTIFQSYQD